jgi:hypothetical protein
VVCHLFLQLLAQNFRILLKRCQLVLKFPLFFRRPCSHSLQLPKKSISFLLFAQTTEYHRSEVLDISQTRHLMCTVQDASDKELEHALMWLRKKLQKWLWGEYHGGTIIVANVEEMVQPSSR